MQIGIDHGGGERTVLYVEASRKGVIARSIALRLALHEHGRDVPFPVAQIRSGASVISSFLCSPGLALSVPTPSGVAA
jgi:hypothetical protein